MGFKTMMWFAENWINLWIVIVLKEGHWIAFAWFSEMVVSAANWDKPIDIFAIGFEEIVDLNASNIMKAR